MSEDMPSSNGYYGINEVSEISGISAFTIRYYDKCGFFPELIRGKRGIRMFTDADIDQLCLVDALRKSGLSIEGIQYFVKLVRKGSATMAERIDILDSRQKALEYQIAELKESYIRLRDTSSILKRESMITSINEI